MGLLRLGHTSPCVRTRKELHQYEMSEPFMKITVAIQKCAYVKLLAYRKLFRQF